MTFQYRDEVAESLIKTIRRGGKKSAQLIETVRLNTLKWGSCSRKFPEMDSTVRREHDAILHVSDCIERIWHWTMSRSQLVEKGEKLVKCIETFCLGEMSFFSNFCFSDPSFINQIVLPIMMLTQSLSLMNYMYRLINRAMRTGLVNFQPLISQVNTSLWYIYHRIKDSRIYANFYLIQSNSSFYMILNDTILITSPWIARVRPHPELPRVTHEGVDDRIRSNGERWIHFLPKVDHVEEKVLRVDEEMRVDEIKIKRRKWCFYT